MSLERVPFFVVHKGNQEYLDMCINSIKEHYPVHLIGDKSNQNLDCVWVEADSLSSDYFDKFESVYKHLSTNSEFFEKICFHRYILMYEYAKKKGYNSFVHCDSDIIVLDDCDSIIELSRNYTAAFLIPEDQSNYRMTASPHFSYWTIQGLQSFIEFFIDFYSNQLSVLEDKFEYHKVNSLPGGVCDMTLLYLFYKDNDKVLNYFKLDKGLGVIDFNVTSCEDAFGLTHVTSLLGKKYKVESGKLFLKYESGYQLMKCLHMQGKAKLFMRDALNRKFFTLYTKIKIFSLLRHIKKNFINSKKVDKTV